MQTKIKKFKRDLPLILLFLILIFGLAVRLDKINSPVADWHSWRQADTSAVTRNYVEDGFNLLYPRYDDLSNIASGKDNPQGYRFVEFPLYNALTLILFKGFTRLNFSVEIWGRLVSIFASLGSVYFLYLIVSKFLNKETALLSAFFFTLLPYNIFYSRVILPEPLMVFTFLATMWFFIEWIGENARLEGQSSKSPVKIQNCLIYGLAIIFAAAALLLKPFAAFLFTPLIYLIWKKLGFRGFIKPRTIFFFGLSVLPFFLWRLWVARFPEGIPAWRWLLNSDGIRFKGAFFYWLFGERLAKLILGYWGLPLLLLGLILKPKKEGLFFHCWGVAMIIYVSVFATGNVKHDYYQIITIPIICIFLAKGAYFLLTEAKKVFNPVTCYMLHVTCIVFMLAFSWREVRTFYWVNRPEIVEAGQIADQILPKEAKVIAPYGGDTAFLYQINRPGWPIGFNIEEKIEKGATHYVSVSPEDPEAKELSGRYKVMEKREKYIIIDLTNALKK